MSDEWFRSESWGRKDRDLFEEKLARARPHSRAQYLRVQGLTLSESPNKRAQAVAGELLERVIHEHADDDLQVAMAHADLGRWHLQTGRRDAAAHHLREAIAREDDMGNNLDTGSDLYLAELIVATEARTAFDEARRLLDRAAQAGLAFKSQRWRWLVADARLAAHTDDAARAAESARAAIELLAHKDPDFPRHPDLGHIETDEETVQDLWRVAKLSE